MSNLIREVLSELRLKNIKIDLIDDNLKVSSDHDEIPSELINKIRINKEEIIDYLEKIKIPQNDQINMPKLSISDRGYSLSSSQRRLWTLSQTEEGSVAYNMPFQILLEGDYDISLFKRAIYAVIDRHEILRTIFKEDDEGELKQWVLTRDELRFEVIHKDYLKKENSKSIALSYIEEDYYKPFDLLTGPLLRVMLLQIKQDECVFYFNVHHIISDGWSMEVMANDVMTYYTSYKEDKLPTLPDLNIQYKDYASWQLSQLTTNKAELDEHYWLSQLSGELPLLDLPSFKKRPAQKTYAGQSLVTYFNAKTLDSLKGMAQENQATLFMTLMASIKGLIYLYTRAEDMIIGTPIAGRYHIDLEDQIGFYVNALSIRSKIDKESSFLIFLAEVKQTLLVAYEHQSYPFDLLVEKLDARYHINRNAIFDVIIVLQQSTEITEFEEDAIVSGEIQTLGRQTSIYDIKFEFEEVGSYLRFLMEYNTDVYDKATMERFMRHYKEYLNHILRFPDAQMKNINCIPENELGELLKVNDFTSKIHVEDKTVVDLFEKQVEKNPNATALIFNDKKCTYAELNILSNKLAHFIIENLHGKTQQKIGLLFDPREEMIASILGILKIGNIYVPLNPSFPEERHKFMIRDTGMELLLTNKNHLELSNRLQWSTSLVSYLCVDSDDVFQEDETHKNVMMDQELWDHVGQEATDQITGGGWASSYTGEAIPTEEMEEYAVNAYKKLKPLLHKDLRVLEIGCSSGLTMFQVAPEVGLYYGTDLSPRILENTQKIVNKKGLKNVVLAHKTADEIHEIEERDFDLIIVNSVIQHFHGHNYLRKVITEAIGLMKTSGHLFIGDVMDIEQKEALIADIKAYQSAHKEVRSKTDFSADLFVSQNFFQDLRFDIPEISQVTITKKICTLENELTKFRYDALLEIDKISTLELAAERSKYQYDFSHVKHHPETNITQRSSPSDIAYIIFTSGTTGTPKGVKISHYNIVRLFMHNDGPFSFSEKDVWSLFHSYVFDFSVWEMFGALLFGGKLVIVPKLIAQNSYNFIKILEKHQVTVLNQTPSAFYELLQQENLKDVSLNVRYVIFGGEALNPSKVALWNSYFPRSKLINMYGITETTVHTTYKELKPEDVLLPTSNIGKALPTVSCYVLNEDLTPCAVGIWGELFVGGSGLATGYLNNEELTNAKFIPHPYKKGGRLYRSGDKVRLLENGELEYSGRLDSQVKIRGYRIELGEVQKAVQSYAAVKSAIIRLTENKAGEKELTAYIIPEAKAVEIKLLRSYLKEELPSYMIPSHYIYLEKFPLTSNGKIDTKAFPSPYIYENVSNGIYKAPSTDFEKKLVIMWEEILDRNPIGISDDFFELGGHSLKATRLLNLYRKEFEIDLKLKDLFVNTTLFSHVPMLTKAETKTWDTIEKVSHQESYPISSSQKMLWVICQFKQASVAYSIPYVFPINSYNVPKFKTAFTAVIERHEILRTVFKQQKDGSVRQFIIPLNDFNFEIKHIDYSSKPNAHALMQQLVESDTRIAYNLENGPLIRVSIVKRADEEQFCYLNMHHIISDGWSMDILQRDVLEFYNSLEEDRTANLPNLPIQYKDYASWQQFQLISTIPNNDRDYWLEQFSDELPIFQFAHSKPRPEIKTYNGNRYAIFIPSAVTENMNAFIKANDGTLFMGIMAILKVLFYKYTGQRDMIIGSPIAGRDHLDLKDQIGFYVNTLTTRSYIDEEASFLTYYETLKNKILDGYNHQRYPFETMVEELSLALDTSRSAIFDVMMVFHNTQQDVLAGAVSENYKDGKTEYNTTSKFDLLFDFEQYKDGMLLQFDYNNDIYDDEIITQFTSHFLHLLSFVPANAEDRLDTLPYLKTSDINQLEQFNATTFKSEEETVVSMFSTQVGKTPNIPAVLFGDLTLTYQEVEDKSNQLADLLIQTRKTSTKDRVGVVLSRSHFSVIAMIGVLKTGACYIPMDPEYPQQRLSYICNDAGLSLIVTEESYEELLSQTAIETTLISDTILSNYSNKRIDQSNYNDPSYVIYTSGSTGNPKGVVQTHKMLHNLISWGIDANGIESGLRFLQYASFSFDASLNDIFFVLCCSGSIYISSDAERLNYAALKEVIINKSIEVLSFPYSALINFFQQQEASNFSEHSIKHIVSTAEQLYVWGNLEAFLVSNENVCLHNQYGPSESHVVTSHTMSYAMGNLVYRPSIGKPIHNSQIHIVDANFIPVGIGIKGEFYIGGSNLAEGYLNLPNQTQERFIQNPWNPTEVLYKTGDFGFWKNDGTITYLGRGDRQVKIRGYRVELEDIVKNLVSLEEVSDAIVLVKEHASEDYLCAYIVAASNTNVGEIRKKLEALLPSYMIPSFIIKLDKFPLTSNGKLNEKLLPSPFSEGVIEREQYVAPRNDKEEKLVKMWKELLGREKIGVTESFFELGGHSLKALMLLTHVEREFNIKISIEEMFKNTTIEKFATVLQEAEKFINKNKEYDKTKIKTTLEI